MFHYTYIPLVSSLLKFYKAMAIHSATWLTKNSLQPLRPNMVNPQVIFFKKKLAEMGSRATVKIHSHSSIVCLLFTLAKPS